jgi:hypothetical protein
MTILLMGTVFIWVGYMHTFIPMGSTHILYVKSWVDLGYSLVPISIFHVTLILLKNYELEYEIVISTFL